MNAYALVLYPDRRLAEVAKVVETFDEGLATRAAGLVEALKRVGAIGLAGPHVGLPERLVVLRLEPGEPVRVFVNPVVVWTGPATATHEEASVSMPGIRESVTRPSEIRFSYRDLDGTPHEESAGGFEAACLQHEIDQLDGIFWIERLSRLRRERVRKRFAKTTRLET